MDWEQSSAGDCEDDQINRKSNSAGTVQPGPGDVSGGGRKLKTKSGAKDGVADGIRTRNNKLHKLGLYH